MHRTSRWILVTSIMGLVSVTEVDGQQTCRPTLIVQEVQFSEMQPPSMERRWSAVVYIDASHCAANSTGHFAIAFIRLKEIGLDIEFREQFVSKTPSVKVAVDFGNCSGRPARCGA